MQPFIKLQGVIAPLELNNVDTDMIIPKEFLKTIKRTGLGANLFHEMRYDLKGDVISSFILNQDGYNQAEILVSGENFGCGSSREHAPWALLDFGIRCVIAPSFADIFYNNCFKNSILPLKLDKKIVAEIIEYSKSKCDNKITIDLEKQEIVAGKNIYKFDIDSFRKNTLLLGLDDIDLTLEQESEIREFENKQRKDLPWLYQKQNVNESFS